MSNEKMIQKGQYEDLCNEAEIIKCELYELRKNSENTMDIIGRLEKLVNNVLADKQLYDLEEYMSNLKVMIRDFKMNKVSIDDVIEYVWSAFDWVSVLRRHETEKKEMQKNVDDIRTFCLECAENLAYPENVRNFFRQCAKNAQGLTKIVDIN